jgi:hypothetical protein
MPPPTPHRHKGRSSAPLRSIYNCLSAANPSAPALPAAASAAAPELIPFGFEDDLLASVWAAPAFAWMSKKESLGQDFFLIGAHGPMRRRLALAWCAREQREIEYVVLTQDTTESDLKQRRELVAGGSSRYFDQGTLQAALHGR